MSDFLNPEDYVEPRCPLCVEANGMSDKNIPVSRVIEKAGEYFSRNDYNGAERLYLYWIDEAYSNNDLRGAFSLSNELMGLYRKIGQKEKAFSRAKDAIELIDRLGISDTVSAGTAYVNAGTVYKAFGEAQKGIVLFEKALEIYEKNLKSNDDRLGGLYNNMALTLTDLGRYKEAFNKYQQALSVMKGVENGELEMAMTYLNLADLLVLQEGLENANEQICNYVSIAEKLINTPTLPKNGYYAFVCEKCAPTFLYYGFFATSEELQKRAKEIYERN